MCLVAVIVAAAALRWQSIQMIIIYASTPNVLVAVHSNQICIAFKKSYRLSHVLVMATLFRIEKVHCGVFITKASEQKKISFVVTVINKNSLASHKAQC